MSGSEDGNVRVWKAKASEKLGVITARERGAIEYRNKLKERWSVDSEVARISRYDFPLPPPFNIDFLMHDETGLAIYRNRLGQRINSIIPCWKRQELRKREGENTRELGNRNRKRKKRNSWSPNRHNDTSVPTNINTRTEFVQTYLRNSLHSEGLAVEEMTGRSPLFLNGTWVLGPGASCSFVFAL